MAETVVAYKTIAYDLGMYIVGTENSRNDYVKWRWSNEKKIHKSVIYYTAKGRPYFKWQSRRYYLDEFIMTL